MKKYLLLIISLLISINTLYAVPMTHKENRITLTEYFDYECPHCRHMAPVLAQLQTAFPALKIETKATPLLNTTSPIIAKLALAAQTVYGNHRLHQALLAQKFVPTVVSTLQLAKSLQMQPQRLVQRANNKRIQQQLQTNIKAASHYAIGGIIHLPIMILANKQGEHFVLYGEQPLNLLSAIVEQLEQDNAGLAQKTHHKD